MSFQTFTGRATTAVAALMTVPSSSVTWTPPSSCATWDTTVPNRMSTPADMGSIRLVVPSASSSPTSTKTSAGLYPSSTMSHRRGRTEQCSSGAPPMATRNPFT